MVVFRVEEGGVIRQCVVSEDTKYHSSFHLNILNFGFLPRRGREDRDDWCTTGARSSVCVCVCVCVCVSTQCVACGGCKKGKRSARFFYLNQI